MTKPAVIGLYGESNTGKTTIITQLIEKLIAENFKIATVKITDKDITIDTEDKDTWKYTQAGSNLVVFSTSSETDYLVQKHQTIDEIQDNIEQLEEYDLVLVEGAHDKTIPKIRIGSIKERENTITTYDGDFEKIYCMIKNEIKRR